MDKFVKECFVANVLYFDALKIWKMLQIGQKVSLSKNTDNNKEINVTISFKDKEYSFASTRCLIPDLEKEIDKMVGSISLNLLIAEEPEGGFLIGNLSKEDSVHMVDVINCNHTEVYYGRISAIDEKSEENKRIKVAIYVKECKKRDM